MSVLATLPVRNEDFPGFFSLGAFVEVKQSCQDENGRGLLHILVCSNPSLIPRAIQGFCMRNRVHISAAPVLVVPQ